jgi:hypothetical protein
MYMYVCMYVYMYLDTFLTKANFCRLVAYLSDASEHVELPPPTIWKPLQLWTGTCADVCMYICMYLCYFCSQVSRSYPCWSDLTPARSPSWTWKVKNDFTRKRWNWIHTYTYIYMHTYFPFSNPCLWYRCRTDKHFCWMDGFVAFRKGELVSGRLGKKSACIHTYIHTYYIYT